MTKKYSIAEARHDLAAIVKELDQQPVIQITRRGEPVAVLISTREFERLSSPPGGFWDAYTAYRDQVDLKKLGLKSELFEDARQADVGREVDL
jgi:cellobiose PTS system EIIB component